MRAVAAAASALNRWTSRWVPGSFTIAVTLTFIVFIAAAALEMSGGKSHPLGALLKCAVAWGDGVWTLLEFGMQMCLIIFTGYIIAVSPPVRRFLSWILSLPRSPSGVILLVALAAMVLSWVNWGLGLVTGAMLVKIASASRRNVDFRLLTAAAYLGLGTTWHAGLSGSVPLLIATPKNFLADRIGVIPVTETIFAPYNLVLVAVIIGVTLLVVRLMVPSPGETVSAAPDLEEEFREPLRPGRPTPAQRAEFSPLPNIFVALLGATCLVYTFGTTGAVLTLNTVNLAFLSLGILLHRNPASLVKAAEQGSRMLHGIVLQFPLYAGIFGMIKGTGLIDVISRAFISVSSTETYPLVVTWYSAFLNTFVPSGGSKWAIEAPYIIKAASHLSVPVQKVAMAYAYGDMWTNLIQPFWAIPILAAAKLEFKDILGYEIVVAIAYGALVSAAMIVI
jgi:short-chain fatty acids transporter